MNVARSDCVLGLDNLPLHVRLHDGTLIQTALFPVEAQTPIRRAQASEVRASLRCRRTAGNQVRILTCAAVTVHARDLNRVTSLAIKFAVTVGVLLEMAVGAVHPLFKMDVL